MRNSRVIGLVAALSAVAVVSACGSSSTDSASAAGGSPKAAIRIMVDTTMTAAPSLGGLSFPYAAVGVQAAAAAINKSGGLGGHQLKVDVCDNKGDPNTSAQCGRQAVSNKDVAVVGSFDTKGAGQILPVLQAAKIPYIGGLPSTPQELNSPVSFQFDPGSTLAIYAFGQLYVDEGCKAVTVVAPQVPGVPESIAAQRAALKAKGVTQTAVFVTPGNVDVAPVVSQVLADKPDCFTYGGDGQSAIRFFSALRAQGYQGKFVAAIGNITPDILKVLGSQGNGLVVLNSTALVTKGDPTSDKFTADMLAYLGNDQKKVDANSNEFGQDGWASVQLLKKAFAGTSSYTSAALLKKLPTMCDVSPGFVYPHVNFCKAAKSKVYSRVYNDYYQYFNAVDGVYKPSDGKWHDLSATLP